MGEREISRKSKKSAELYYIWESRSSPPHFWMKKKIETKDERNVIESSNRKIIFYVIKRTLINDPLLPSNNNNKTRDIFTLPIGFIFIASFFFIFFYLLLIFFILFLSHCNVYTRNITQNTNLLFFSPKTSTSFAQKSYWWGVWRRKSVFR